MKFGFCVMSDIDEIGFYPFIEGLGYDSAWVADSQMIYSDVYMVLALAAQQTKRLRLGPGTGNTAMRTMGQKPMKIAAFAEYLRVMRALFDAEVVDYAFEGIS